MNRQEVARRLEALETVFRLAEVAILTPAQEAYLWGLADEEGHGSRTIRALLAERAGSCATAAAILAELERYPHSWPGVALNFTRDDFGL